MTDPVCALCRHLYIVSKGDAWWRWLCSQAPREQEYNPVTGDTVADPPYARCREVNREGNCPMFDAGPNVLHPKETAA